MSVINNNCDFCNEYYIAKKHHQKISVDKVTYGVTFKYETCKDNVSGEYGSRMYNLNFCPLCGIKFDKEETNE